MNNIEKIVARVLELDAEASPGPWKYRERKNWWDFKGIVGGEHDDHIIGVSGDESGEFFTPPYDAANEGVLTEYREAAPALAREVLRLKALLAAKEESK